jgi:PTH1 family peptidyl-tRNA hydrolase
MKLVVGLGNPGSRYARTRHNVGFEVVEVIATRHRLEWEAAPRGTEADISRWRASDVLLAKPLTFMNASGTRSAGSAGGHNGLKSVIQALGTDQFPRMRVGVGRGEARRDLADHVLAKFEPDEGSAVAEMIERASEAVELFVADGIQPVMNKFNRKEDRKEETE